MVKGRIIIEVTAEGTFAWDGKEVSLDFQQHIDQETVSYAINDAKEAAEQRLNQLVSLMSGVSFSTKVEVG